MPLNAISRVIGRGGSNINAIRTATGAHIEVEKQSKGQGERIITLKGSLEATKQAHLLIAALVKDPDVDILQILPKSANKSAAAVWEKSVVSFSFWFYRFISHAYPNFTYKLLINRPFSIFQLTICNFSLFPLEHCQIQTW